MLKTERLQVLVEVAQRERLEREAAARQTSVATLVRQAIDLAFPPDLELKWDAGQAVLDAPLMPVAETDDLLAELDALRGARR